MGRLTDARRKALRVLLAAQRRGQTVEVGTVTFGHTRFPSSIHVAVARWLRDNGHVVTDPVDVLDLATDVTRRVAVQLTTKGRRLAEQWEQST